MYSIESIFTYQFVNSIGKECFDVLFDMCFRQGRQFGVQLRVHFVAAHIFYRLIQLFQRIFDGFRRLYGDDGLLQFFPCLILVVFRQCWLDCRKKENRIENYDSLIVCVCDARHDKCDLLH